MPRRRDRRSQFISFRCVVQHDIQNHFDPGAMKGLDHLSELQRLLPVRSSDAVGLLRRKERNRIVAPIVREFLFGYRVEPDQFVFVEFGNRHQLNCGHPQVFEIRNFFGQGARRSRDAPPRTGMDCESAYMRLIDHRIGGGMLRRRIRLPVEMVAGKDAFRRGARIIDG